MSIDVSALSDSESSDHYRLIVAQLADRLRVIDDGDRQWILQYRKGCTWRSVSYHQDRDALISTACGSEPVPAALAALPARYPRGRPIPQTAHADLITWIKGTLLVGKINHAGELGLMMPLSSAVDEINYCKPVAYEVSAAMLSLMLKAAHIRAWGA